MGALLCLLPLPSLITPPSHFVRYTNSSAEVLAEIISDPVCKDMLIDIGMGVRHRNVRYNCLDHLRL